MNRLLKNSYYSGEFLSNAHEVDLMDRDHLLDRKKKTKGRTKNFRLLHSCGKSCELGNQSI